MHTPEPVRHPPPEVWLSAKMAKFPRGETKPELLLRSALHGIGLRYRVHFPVPGIPRRKIDIAFTKRRVAIFVDGCFWHNCPEHGRTPARNSEWWTWKLEGNRARDEDTNRVLAEQGWAVVRVWEHLDVETMVETVQKAVLLSRRSE